MEKKRQTRSYSRSSSVSSRSSSSGTEITRIEKKRQTRSHPRSSSVSSRSSSSAASGDEKHKKERRSHSQSSASKVKESYAHTEDAYLGENTDTLPSSTSYWSTFCLDKVGIFYDDTFQSSPLDILDMIYERTDCFGSLDEDQNKYADDLKKQLSFDFHDFDDLAIDPSQSRITEIVTKLNDQLHVFRKEYSKGNFSLVPEEFIHDVINILRYAAARFRTRRLGQGPVPEALYTIAFTHFARMCRIEALPGVVWRSKMTICNTNVSSTADILLMPLKFPESVSLKDADADSVAVVVSVVEVKRDTKKKNSADGLYSIYDYLDHHVLGQHGGELLLYSQYYEGKLSRGRYCQRVHPGMIVVGTEVIFTLLDVSASHLEDVYNQKKIVDKAKIYYSRPKDMLKKEDRDVLIEAIIRLNNI